PSPSPAPTAAVTPAPTATPAPTPEPTPSPAPTFTPEPAFTGLLSAGSKGVRVMQLQERLRDLNYYHGLIDGRFGSQTHSALVNFQRANALSADGVMGPKTYNALYSPEAVAAPDPTAMPVPGADAGNGYSP
ncbi:MAG: peptidoglycan-binding protein, partial [Clostridia bacterium]|nr:peptidoglycan-binding protein [Clostridia bacterium]